MLLDAVQGQNMQQQLISVSTGATMTFLPSAPHIVATAFTAAKDKHSFDALGAKMGFTPLGPSAHPDSIRVHGGTPAPGPHPSPPVAPGASAPPAPPQIATPARVSAGATGTSTVRYVLCDQLSESEVVDAQNGLNSFEAHSLAGIINFDKPSVTGLTKPIASTGLLKVLQQKSAATRAKVTKYLLESVFADMDNDDDDLALSSLQHDASMEVFTTTTSACIINGKWSIVPATSYLCESQVLEPTTFLPQVSSSDLVFKTKAFEQKCDNEALVAETDANRTKK